MHTHIFSAFLWAYITTRPYLQISVRLSEKKEKNFVQGPPLIQSGDLSIRVQALTHLLVPTVWLLLFFTIISKQKARIKNPASSSFSVKFVLHAHMKIIASSAPQSPNNFLLQNIFFVCVNSNLCHKQRVHI